MSEDKCMAMNDPLPRDGRRREEEYGYDSTEKIGGGPSSDLDREPEHVYVGAVPVNAFRNLAYLDESNFPVEILGHCVCGERIQYDYS